MRFPHRETPAPGGREAPRLRLPALAVPAALATCLLLACATAAGAQSSASMRLAWAVLHRHGELPPQPIDYERRVVPLATGDRIRIYLRPLSPCYVYVYLHDSRQDLTLLFPQGAALPAEPSPAGRTCSLPGGDSWYRLDEQGGVELFYLVVSARRLDALEAATTRLLRAGEASSRREEDRHRVLEEIKRLMREGSRLASAQEKPLAVAGGFRGLGEEGEFPGRVIEARSVYVRTFRIRH